MEEVTDLVTPIINTDCYYLHTALQCLDVQCALFALNRTSNPYSALIYQLMLICR